MTYHNRLPTGAIGGYDAPTTPPRYVPGRPAMTDADVADALAVRRKSLDVRPLSDEYDTLPVQPAVTWPRYRRRSRLYWLVRDLGWWAQEQWDIARFETGWAGQIALMVLCAVAVCAVALAVVLWGLR